MMERFFGCFVEPCLLRRYDVFRVCGLSRWFRRQDFKVPEFLKALIKVSVWSLLIGCLFLCRTPSTRSVHWTKRCSARSSWRLDTFS